MISQREGPIIRDVESVKKSVGVSVEEGASDEEGQVMV